MTLQSSAPITLSQILSEAGVGTTGPFAQSNVYTLDGHGLPINMLEFLGKSLGPPAGTLLSTYCSGFDLYGTYANGSGGSYNSLIESNSASCGWYPASTSTPGYDYSSSYTFTAGRGRSRIQYHGLPLCARSNGRGNYPNPNGDGGTYYVPGEGGYGYVDGGAAVFTISGGATDGASANMQVTSFALAHDHLVVEIYDTQTGEVVGYGNYDVNENVTPNNYQINTTTASVSVGAGQTRYFSVRMHCEYDGDYDYSWGPDGLYNLGFY